VRKLDVFNHIYPRPYFDRMLAVAPGFKDIGKRMRGIPMLIDLDERFRVMDRFEDYQQILSIATPPIEVYSTGRTASTWPASPTTGWRSSFGSIRIVFRDSLRRCRSAIPMRRCARSSARSTGWRPRHPALLEHQRQAARHARTPGAVRSHGEYDLPVWLHPYRGAGISDYASETKSKFEIWWTFGWPYETSVAMARLVFSGIFDRHPGLKIITHHLGAMAPYFEGRVGPGWDQLGTRTSDEDYTSVLKGLKKRPIDYFRMFYGDTAVFGGYDATVCGLNFFGADHVLFASDAPFDPEKGPMYIRETIAILDRLPMPERIARRSTGGTP
jgi:hypothetical protein